MNEWVNNKISDWESQIDEDVEIPEEMLLAEFLLDVLNENSIEVSKKEWKKYLESLGYE
jgi:hypothetical protein